MKVWEQGLHCLKHKYVIVIHYSCFSYQFSLMFSPWQHWVSQQLIHVFRVWKHALAHSAFIKVYYHHHYYFSGPYYNVHSFCSVNCVMCITAVFLRFFCNTWKHNDLSLGTFRGGIHPKNLYMCVFVCVRTRTCTCVKTFLYYKSYFQMYVSNFKIRFLRECL